MHFWESEPDRLERTISTLEQRMPGSSYFTASEWDTHPEPHFNQTILVEVVYRNLTGFYDWAGLWSDLAKATSAHRGSVNAELIRVSGPTHLVAALAFHILLIPYLLLRFWWLGPYCTPARPRVPLGDCRWRLSAISMASGAFIGMTATAIFSVGHNAGLLTFSERMPTLHMFGVTPEMLWVGAFLIALAGAVEEAFFRGLMLRRFVQNDLPVVGVLVCAFWFTLIHFSYFSWDSGNIAYALWIGAMGTGLGFLTLRMGSWVPAAIVHASYNFAVTLVAGIASFG